MQGCDSGDPESANGFVFDGIDEGSLNSALDRALQYYRDRLDWWQRIAKRNMELDYSWDKSAKEYITIYNSILQS